MNVFVSESRSLHGHSAVLLLTILVQYRKYESANPYVVKLSILDQELALHGYAQVITASLLTYTKAYEESCAGSYSSNSLGNNQQFGLMLLSDQTSSGWFSSLTSMVGNMFVSEEGGPRVEQMRALNSALLALYEGVHLNRNFIAVLAHYQADAHPSPLPTPRSGGAAASSAPATPTPATVNGADPALAAPPNNLLVTFLEYCSIVMQVNLSQFLKSFYFD